MEKIALQIKTRRKALRMTQQELADLSGCSHPVIVQLENGQSIRTENLVNIAQTLGYEVQLVNRERKNGNA